MTNKKILLGILAITLVFGLMIAGCVNDSSAASNSKMVKYESKDSEGVIYSLTITDSTTDKAAYKAKAGDNYELKIVPVSGTSKTSQGTVQSLDISFLVLMPSGSETPFNVVIANGQMTAIMGLIFCIEGEIVDVSSGKGLTPNGSNNSNNNGGGDISGTYRYDADGAFGWAEITFNNPNFTMNGSLFGNPMTASGTYTVSGNTITLKTVNSNDPSEIGKDSIFTIIDATHIRDEDKGDTWTKK